MDISSLRKDYKLKSLEESRVQHQPLSQFEVWFNEALKANVLEANAMVISTCSSSGRPSSRIVLLKEIDDHGFVFFTNYSSKKASELAENPYASLTFFWPELERQVRIEGKVSKISIQESEEYYNSRPRESRIGAWSSAQSSKIKNREELENAFNEFSAKFKDKEIPKPDFWGGYRLKPDYLEFWQGRPSRMHDRISYEKEGENWKIYRLSP